MVKLEDLKPGMPLVGLEPASGRDHRCRCVPIGEGSIQVFYRTADGQTKEDFWGVLTSPILLSQLLNAVVLRWRWGYFSTHMRSKANRSRVPF